MTGRKVIFIAEAGVNHNGSLEKAMAMVDIAAKAGADYIKFQTFKAADLASHHAAMADYQKEATGLQESQLAMLSRLELDDAAHRALKAHCGEVGVGFLSTPFELGSLDFLVSDLGLRSLKIGSGDLNNGPLVYRAALSGVNLILSTGMATLGEVEETLGLIALAYGDEPPEIPSTPAIRGAWGNPALRSRVRERVTLLHCVSDYPAAPETIDLATMDTLVQAFGVAVGYSDHMLGSNAVIAAVSRGAACIEKHFTLDRDLPGPDHQASLEPQELMDLVAAVREVELLIGSPVKSPSSAELATAEVARKVVVAAKPVRASERLGPDNLTTQRSGAGISAMRYWSLFGTKADRDYAPGDPIRAPVLDGSS